MSGLEHFLPDFGYILHLKTIISRILLSKVHTAGNSCIMFEDTHCSQWPKYAPRHRHMRYMFWKILSPSEYMQTALFQYPLRPPWRPYDMAEKSKVRCFLCWSKSSQVPLAKDSITQQVVHWPATSVASMNIPRQNALNSTRSMLWLSQKCFDCMSARRIAEFTFDKWTLVNIFWAN